MRRFEKVSRIDEEIELPKRSTKNSAGHDFFAPCRIDIPPYKIGDNPILVRTGIKVEMPNNEFLMLVNRSSNPKKKNLVIPNSMGIVDYDYVDSAENEGEMMFAFYNLSNEPILLEKGYGMGQGIFQKYYTTVDDNADGERTGGFGSTNKN